MMQRKLNLFLVRELLFFISELKDISNNHITRHFISIELQKITRNFWDNSQELFLNTILPNYPVFEEYINSFKHILLLKESRSGEEGDQSPFFLLHLDYYILLGRIVSSWGNCNSPLEGESVSRVIKLVKKKKKKAGTHPQPISTEMPSPKISPG